VSKKFIPNGAVDFATMAESFARNIATHQQALEVSAEESEALTAAVVQYRKALLTTPRSERSPASIARREEARKEAEKLIRALARRIRGNERVPIELRVSLNLERNRPKQKALPDLSRPPHLEFSRALHESGGLPEHELRFFRKGPGHGRPEGVTRIELFVDLISPDEPIPDGPAAVRGSGESAYVSRPLYLRSFTKSPIRVKPPMASTPMRVIYWARWADAQGNVSPMSSTAVGWIEGGSHHLIGLMTPAREREMLKVEIGEPRMHRQLVERDATMVMALIESGEHNATQAATRELPAPANEREAQAEAA
jgi:hypothetical protein